MTQSKKIAILGASGYTGAELVRLISSHPFMDIVALGAERKAGMEMSEVFPHLRHLNLPKLNTGAENKTHTIFNNWWDSVHSSTKFY